MMQTTHQHLPLSPAHRCAPMVAAALAGILSLGAVAAALPGGTANAAASTTATRRVDLATPTFSNPTDITNALFPAGALDQAVQLGTEGDVALRHEITLRDETRVIRWDGRDIEAVVLQFLAYGDGEIREVATDYFAQADDGSVWYLGEDVTNYQDGKIANHNGTWLAGRDGPGGMIMPANPQVGDVYMPENIPGLVFEEVTVKQTNVTVDGPNGPVAGAVVVQERLMDGTLEDKIFAPGYGEFEASVPSADELVRVAIAVPTDGANGQRPKALDRLSDTARRLFDDATAHNWSHVSALARDAHRSWDAVSAGDVPPLLDRQLNGVLDALDSAVGSMSTADTRQAAIELELASLDIEMQYEETQTIDEDRIEVWRLQLRVHRAAGDLVGAASDRAIVTAIADRLPD